MSRSTFDATPRPLGNGWARPCPRKTGTCYGSRKDLRMDLLYFLIGPRCCTKLLITMRLNGNAQFAGMTLILILTGRFRGLLNFLLKIPEASLFAMPKFSLRDRCRR